MSNTAAQVDIILKLQSDLSALNATLTGMRAVKEEVRATNRAGGDMGQVGQGLRNMANGVAGLLGVGFSASFIAGQVRGTLQWAGALNDLATQANTSAQAFQTLAILAAEGGGVKMEQVALAAETLRRNLQSARDDGTSPMNASLRQLGLTAAGLQALAPERQWEVIGVAINNATDKQAAYNAASELFGTKNAPKLMASLQRLGREGFDRVSDSLAGLRIPDSQLETLDNAGDLMDRLILKAKILGAQAFLKVGNELTLNGARLESDPEKRDAKRLAWVQENFPEGHGLRVMHEESVAKNRALRAGPAEGAPYGGGAGSRSITPEEGAKILADANTRQTMAAAEAAAQREALAVAYAASQTAIEEAGNMVRQASLDSDEAAAVKDAEARRLAAEKAGRAALNDEVAKGEYALREYGRALAQLDASPFLTGEQKRAARIAALGAENAQIEKQIANLEKMKGAPGVDDAQVVAQQRQLGDRAANNSGQIAADSPLGVGGGAVAGLVDYLGQIPALAERARASALGIADAFSNGVASSLEGLIYQTMTWEQALGNIARSVVSEIISSFVRMVAQWITQQIVMAVFGNAIRAAQLAALAPMAAATTAIWAPAATAASIATMGGAAVEGATAAKIAIATSAVGFADGGYTGAGGKYDVAGLVHAGEFVMPADVTSRLGPDALYAMMDAVRAPAGLGVRRSFVGGAGPSALAPATAGGNSRPERLIVHTNDEAVVQRLMQDTTYQNQVVRLNRQKRHEFGVGG